MTSVPASSHRTCFLLVVVAGVCCGCHMDIQVLLTARNTCRLGHVLANLCQVGHVRRLLD